MLFFTNKGKVHWLKVYHVPESSRQAKGKAIVNLLSLKDEQVTKVISNSSCRNLSYTTVRNRFFIPYLHTIHLT